MICPSCERPMPGEEFDDQNRMVLCGDVWEPVRRGAAWAMLGCLRKNYLQIVPKERLIQVCSDFWQHPDGPIDVEEALRVNICHLRRSLEGTEHMIITHYGVGYGLHPRGGKVKNKRARYV